MFARSNLSRSRAGQRGISRFEAKLGALVVALTVTGVVYATSKADSDDRAESSRTSASKILKAAQAYTQEDPSACPTVSSLKRDQLLDVDASDSDAWGQRFRVVCGEELSVRSAGADGKLHSSDDVEQHRPAS